ncbi:hypothetical protein PULV_a1969 [Pseudoalteromonas ulvae UL12]|uniref:HD-GYP domain-containing protein n=1 Tax=Pseudoalteromonas ulvae TaxID=107327 RepID=A0A244CQ65_PSEDV|nr:HD domain-containing phosphohydrolase [Pseudoalteromonas ulvae]MBE0365210.1 hypothetical protein [Pseudoalteromonas ulvae UL12]OUL57754.1 hypothetical protein B1199_11915 [Pseudoalteromonas ulvae]
MNSFERVSITKLTVGSYVEKVTKQLGDVRVVQTGWVRNKKAIKDLQQKGVIEVLVDPYRTLKEQQSKQAPIIEKTPKTKHHHFSDEFPHAQALYEQLEQAMLNLEERVLSFQPINIGQLAQLGEHVNESITRQPSTLLCIANICSVPNSIIGHSIRVAILAMICAKQLKRPSDEVQALFMTGLLHDLGKYKLAEQLQRQDHLLNPYLKVQRHKYCQYTQHILNSSGGACELTLSLCQQQLEREDGSGYPEQLNSAQLSAAQKILTICDTFDSLHFGFEGEKPFSSPAVFKYLLKHAPSLFSDVLIKKIIHSISVYPPGSLVQLKSGKVGYVKCFKENNLSLPVVHCFYNSKSKHYTQTHDIIVAKEFSDDLIESNIFAHDFNINLTQHL